MRLLDKFDLRPWLFVLFLLAMSDIAWAAGTVTETHTELGTVRKITLTCTGDASDGSFPDTAISKFSGKLLALETNPGATGPSANYDITLVDEHGHDVLEGVGADRHTSNTERAAIVFSSTSVHPPVSIGDTLTLNIDNNAVNSATVVIELYYAPN